MKISIRFWYVFVAMTLVLLINQTAYAITFQVWSDRGGLMAIPFCETEPVRSTVDHGLDPYLESPFALSDGTKVSVYRENDMLMSARCSMGQEEKKYMLFNFIDSVSAKSVFIAVNGDENQIFNRPEVIWGRSSSINALKEGLPEGVEVLSGSLDYVVCTSSSTLNVRDESLNKVLFTVPRYSSIKPVQSFGTDRIKKVIDGVEYSFTKAEFPQAAVENKIGWVAEKFVISRQQCPGAQTSSPNEPVVNQAWTFPTLLRPSSSYKDGMRRFKASRSSGRLHAACDLYRKTGEDALAVSSGTIIRDKYYFYEGTYAIEVKHTGGKVARYGEITGKAAPNISLNKSVRAGQTVGYIGKVNSGCCTPMLHFEFYAGTASGALSQSGNSFRRRKDLLDPTDYLTEWEKAKFGQSY